MTSHILANINGPLFRQQRQLLIKLADQASNSKPCQLTEHDRELLEGLMNLTDALADEAYDHYKINCLLTSRN